MQNELVVIPAEQLRQLVTDAVDMAMNRARREAEKTAQPATEPNKLLTKKEAAQLLKVSIATVDNYTKDGMLTKKRIGLRSVRFDRSEVEKLARTI